MAKLINFNALFACWFNMITFSGSFEGATSLKLLTTMVLRQNRRNERKKEITRKRQIRIIPSDKETIVGLSGCSHFPYPH